MMKKTINAILFGSIVLLSVLSCTQEALETEKQLPTPKIVVNDVTTTSFNVNWGIVTDAGSFTYIFNGGEAVTTTERKLSFTDLEPAVEYEFSIKSDAGHNTGWKDSEWLTVKITTEGESSLASPEPYLVAAYMSKTIINWKSIPDASSYEYSVGKFKGTVTACSVELSGLEGDTEYEFKLKAVSKDPHIRPSAEASLKFRTKPASEDIPQIMMSINEVGCDYIDFNIYAVSDFRYLYFAVPAVYFEGHSDEEVLNTYLRYVMEAIKANGYSLEAGVDIFASYGSSNFVESNIYPEMSYYVIAFGIDKTGNPVTSLYKHLVKTLANGASDGPKVVGADWFKQSLYYYEFGGYNPTNCLGFNWKGTDVNDILYIMTSTYSFRTYFDSSIELLRKYVKALGSRMDKADVYSAVNSENGYSYRYDLNPASSYTMATIAVNSANDSTFVVNSLGTKAKPGFYDWVFLTLGPSSKYPAQSALAATIAMSFDKNENLNIKAGKLSYLLKESDSLEGVSSEEAEALVDREGTELTTVELASFNMTGSISLSFGTDGNPLDAGKRYTLLVNLTSVNGDKLFRSRTASTEGEASGNTATKSAGTLRYKAMRELNPGRILDLYEF